MKVLIQSKFSSFNNKFGRLSSIKDDGFVVVYVIKENKKLPLKFKLTEVIISETAMI